MPASVIHGDCIATMRAMEANSIDAVVTDPPYHLTSIVDRFGKPGSAPAKHGTDGAFARASKGFMGQEWDGGDIAFRVETWAEAYRVLKPGGHLVAFAASRNSHRMTCAIEDAGFEIRDSLIWIYGTGFPKSLNIGKAIDKIGGVHPNWNATAYSYAVIASGYTHADVDAHVGIKASSCYWARTDHRACVPLYRHWQAARSFLGLGDDFAKVTDAADREVIGKSHKDSSPLAGNNDGTWSDGQVDGSYGITAPATPEAAQWQGWGSALKPAHEPIVLARKPLDNCTIAANVLKHGVGGINIDSCRVEGAFVSGWSKAPGTKSVGGIMNVTDEARDAKPDSAIGRFPANVLHDGSDEVMAAFAAFGERPGQQGRARTDNAVQGNSVYGSLKHVTANPEPRGDTGTAARFFYSAKASAADRAGSKHPTVKPLALMRWLCRLICPPGGTILDPFAGSGTTLQAAHECGLNAIGCEQSAEYVEDINRRLDAMMPAKPALEPEVTQLDMFA